MDFGKVAPEEIEQIDFKLPPDHPGTASVLSEAKPGNSKIFVGCAKWGRKDWIGKIYPFKTKEADFLSHYSTHFNCIELNATFYRMPTFKQTEAWRNKVDGDFKFCPKFTDNITHVKRLKDVRELTDQFIEGISGFGNTLGHVWFIPHPQMGPKTLELQQAFIESIPKDISLFAEQRHKEWYTNAEAFDKLFTIMQKNKTGSIITDASGRRDCVHMRLSTPEAFIRFVGNGLHPTDYVRIDDWVQRIKNWRLQGIQTVYFFMHQHNELHSPELCKYLIQQLNKHCGTTAHEPEFIEGMLPESEEKPKSKTRKVISKRKDSTKNDSGLTLFS
ncbi:hypothetical protein WSM22_44530 [Cytophagales bacterium WSM2-2]|nr:hypothetical protein WSM22_44530 [Cytophagales bacterium WSM2-2]